MRPDNYEEILNAFMDELKLNNEIDLDAPVDNSLSEESSKIYNNLVHTLQFNLDQNLKTQHEQNQQDSSVDHSLLLTQ
eukprot:CAMPEP_0116991022 /NCGR_PEP_ID=MMETSP0467-20121206/65866_1 /TAXON_ID=283647 /ORGANISM="Mesodinium pulex, Strain SPMC105" /LENGTH=77 /DNA_ID=CAMNT_0004687977 /DNA_START=626 /DNA_END=859 /DNA_ORIENTATION=+